MEIKLNVYKTRSLKTVEKTYSVSDFRLSFGACEDILNAINIDLFTGNLDALSDEGKAAEMLKMVIDALPVIKDILKDVLPEQKVGNQQEIFIEQIKLNGEFRAEKDGRLTIIE